MRCELHMLLSHTHHTSVTAPSHLTIHDTRPNVRPLWPERKDTRAPQRRTSSIHFGIVDIMNFFLTRWPRWSSGTTCSHRQIILHLRSKVVTAGWKYRRVLLCSVPSHFHALLLSGSTSQPLLLFVTQLPPSSIPSRQLCVVGRSSLCNPLFPKPFWLKSSVARGDMLSFSKGSTCSSESMTSFRCWFSMSRSFRVWHHQVPLDKAQAVGGKSDQCHERFPPSRLRKEAVDHSEEYRQGWTQWILHALHEQGACDDSAVFTDAYSWEQVKQQQTLGVPGP